MKKPTLTKLNGDERLRAFRYHIAGIIEATENVIELVKTLNATYDCDPDAFATTTSQLEVEAFDHLGYHLKSLRVPLRRLQREAYSVLKSKDKDDLPSSPKRTAEAKPPPISRRMKATGSRRKR